MFYLLHLEQNFSLNFTLCVHVNQTSKCHLNHLEMIFCSLQTQIKLTVLDIDIHSVDKTRCIGDWLEYTTPGVMWGDGVRMCNATQLNKTHLIGGNLELHFRADSMNESRGFWIKYEGMLKTVLFRNISIPSGSIYNISIWFRIFKGRCIF